SVLRAEPACSDVSELTAGRFQHVIQDKEVGDAKAIILCSGKIAHELRAYRKKRNLTDRAIVTIEQFYPFPEDQLVEAIARHGKNSKVIWVQEEPSNMGALNFLRPKLKTVVGNRWVTSVKRYESAGPATGSAKAHKLEQQTLLELAFA
ncbi:MAG: 2-oxoglutarate dehydrogenase E1 component, partial [Candidatus Krumholzibacteria bacterium]|nr:2-oxoglutarate dehydrogenase E1 component [Candidatus Krumholzibacteria bacterium]